MISLEKLLFLKALGIKEEKYRKDLELSHRQKDSRRPICCLVAGRARRSKSKISGSKISSANIVQVYQETLRITTNVRVRNRTFVVMIIA